MGTASIQRYDIITDTAGQAIYKDILYIESGAGQIFWQVKMVYIFVQAYT